jgi:protein-tyrosine phosphatase
MLGAASAWLAIGVGGAGLALLWPAESFLLVSVAYLKNRPAMLGKRTDGTIKAWALLLLGPYFLLTWAIWHADRILRREDCANEVAPGLWVGRRPLAGEVPVGVRVIVDLTAEFPAVRAVREHPGYVCVPVLDGGVPEGRVFGALIGRLEGETGVYVHCASGHGRSGMLAAALLMRRGIAGSVDEAEVELRRGRAGIRLNRGQRGFLGGDGRRG